eukprot:TRINITY_DN817_c0_g1_i2.p1 TRINITY_DN817_c0_g1~~TRINITY_DN817_c0_g1_i2.p1  ORF type:complete len:118 (+),score=10.61 TRINITY_DN817_c0_g1_i2:159-512(+)
MIQFDLKVDLKSKESVKALPRHEKRAIRVTTSSVEIIKLEHPRTPIARSNTGSLPAKSILKSGEQKKRKKSRSVIFDEENVVVTSKRKQARDFCDKVFSKFHFLDFFPYIELLKTYS